MNEKHMLKAIEALASRIADLEEDLKLAVFLRDNYKKQLDDVQAAYADSMAKLASVQGYIDRMAEVTERGED